MCCFQCTLTKSPIPTSANKKTTITGIWKSAFIQTIELGINYSQFQLRLYSTLFQSVSVPGSRWHVTYTSYSRRISRKIKESERNHIPLFKACTLCVNLVLKKKREGLLTLEKAKAILSPMSFALSTRTGNFFPVNSYALNNPPRYRIVVSKTLQ